MLSQRAVSEFIGAGFFTRCSHRLGYLYPAREITRRVGAR
jgi:hypothetical protein